MAMRGWNMLLMLAPLARKTIIKKILQTSACMWEGKDIDATQ
jgi:hypothetical protein